MVWLVVCAHCGRSMPINGLNAHFENRHNWKTVADGSVDTRSNPFSREGGL
jgi:hypothetical protein